MRNKRTIPWLSLIAFVVTLSLLLSACAAGQAPAKKVKLGLGGPITGPAAFDGTMARDAAILAVEQAKSKVPNLELLIEDDKSDPKEGAAIANKFVGDADLVGVIGHYNSSVTLAAAPITDKAGVAQISYGSSSPKITGFAPHLYRTQPTDRSVGENIVQWAIEAGHKKVAVIYEDTDFGKGLQHVYEDLWPKDGRTILLMEAYLSGKTTDFSAILTKVKAANPDAILLGSLYNEAALIGKQARQLGMPTQFYGDNSQVTQAMLDLGGAAMEGWRAIGAFDPDSSKPEVQAFVKAFKDKYNKVPNWIAAQSFDAANIFIEAIQKAGPDRKKVQDWIFNMKDFPGITGKTTFVQGDCAKALFRFTVKSGKYVSQ